MNEELASTAVRIVDVRTRPSESIDAAKPILVEVQLDLEVPGVLHCTAVVRRRRTGQVEVRATRWRARRGSHTLLFTIPPALLAQGLHAIDVEAVVTADGARVGGAARFPAATFRTVSVVPPRMSCESLDASWAGEHS